jgi:hypothetical protein
MILVSFFVLGIGRSMFDHPVALFVLFLFYSSACLLLGILSWKRADCFKSSLSVLLLLLARIFSFFITYVLTFGVASFIGAPRPRWTHEMHLKQGITFGFLALLFLGVTFALTLVKKTSHSGATSLT